MRRKKLIALASLMLLVTVACSAALTSGYYKIKNTGYTRYMCEDFSSNYLTTSTTCGDADYEKMWKVTVSGSNVTIQNVYTGHYIQSQSTGSTVFPTGSSVVSIALTDKGDDTYMLSSGSYMHCAASQSYNVVNWWDSESQYSIWAFESVSLTDDQVATIQSEFSSNEDLATNASSYNNSLLGIFTDFSCSELNSTYKSYNDKNFTSNLNKTNLPTSLKNIAVKVKNNWSDETNGTYSKMFRVHEYKCYSEAGYWCGQLRAEQMNDMSNPTGIYTNSKGALYVFVGGDIPTDCSLRVVGCSGNDRVTYTAGTALQKGLNVVMTTGDLKQYYIMYSSSNRTTAMADIAKLKIHIEGGNVIGYVDTEGMTSETEVNAKYKGVLDHANTELTNNSIDATSLNLMVLGDRGMFMFPVDTYNQIWKTTPYNSGYTTNYNIYKSIRWFDSVLAWEWGLMGFTKRVKDGQTDEHEHVTGGTDEYGTVCNNKALTLQGASGTNPYATWQYTSMPGVSGVESSYNAERADFDNWCVGHESGHDNQGFINLPSSTESSNNLFSNVVCYLTGYRMSRGEPVSTTNNDYVSGTQFALRDIGSTHRMYWQLYLYYHEAQNKTDFYPTLFGLLRNDPLILNSGTCFTEFYKKVCDAAQEDLTDFFTVWGFLQPFENQVFGDYTTRTLTLTQAEIDAAKEYVKGKNYSKNDQVLFIEDRIEESYRWDAWADGDADVRASQGYSVGQCGTMGSVNDMTPDSKSSATGDFVYSVSNGLLTLDGTADGAGVIVYDKEGNIVAYGNGTSIKLPVGISDYNQLNVVAVANDGTIETVESVVDAGDAAQQLEALTEVLDAAQEILSYEDSNGKMVGYFKTAYLEDLKSLVSQANNIILSNMTTSYGNMINLLTEEIANVRSNENAVVKIVEGNIYSIKNNLYSSRLMSINSENGLTTSTNSTASTTERWIFESAGNGRYYIKNESSNTYLSYSKTSVQVKANATNTEGTATSSTEDVAYTYSIVSSGYGTYYLQAEEASGSRCLHCASSDSYKVVGWNSGAEASLWTITCEETIATSTELGNLENLIVSSQNLLNLVASNYVEAGTYKVDLEASKIYSNYKEPKEGSYAAMIDNDESTYFHSTWSETTTDLHYWQIDLEVGQSVGQFNFSITSRTPSTDNPNNFPKNITIEGSNDGTEFTTITTVTNECASTGKVSWTSETIGTTANKYRYLKFIVNSTTSGNVGNTNSHQHDYFALAEFSINKVQSEFTYDLNEQYSYVTGTNIEFLYKEVKTASEMVASADASIDEITAEIQTLTEKYNYLKNEIDNKEKDTYKSELETLIAKTNNLLAMSAANQTVTESTSTNIELTASMLSSNHDEAELTGEGSLANLLDGKTNTIFHSAWSVDYDDAHYLQVDLGEGNSVGLFTFSFTSRTSDNNKSPIDITISGSNDGSNFTKITNLTSSSANPLPTATSGANIYNSSVIGSSNTTYRYIRYTVNKTNSNTEYFCLSEFSMNSVTPRTFGGEKVVGYADIDNSCIVDAIDNVSSATSLISAENYTTATASSLKYQVSSLTNAYNNLLAAISANVSFKISPSFNDATWYAITVHTDKYYLNHVADATSMDLTSTTTQYDDKDLFCFVGNIEDGFKIYNKAAGDGYVLSSAKSTFDGQTGAVTYAIMTPMETAETQAYLWDISKSTYIDGGFYIGQHNDGNSGKNKLNRRSSKLAYWNQGADAGSTFLFVDAKEGLVSKLNELKAVDAFTIVDDATVICPTEYKNTYNMTAQDVADAYSYFNTYTTDDKTFDELRNDLKSDQATYLNNLKALNNSYGIPLSITYTVKAGSRYGTIILPVNWSIPNNWTVYTCAATEEDGSTLTLVQSSVAKKNTPYIISTKEASEKTFQFIGYSTGAGTENVTSGLLTGVLTDQATKIPDGSYVLTTKKSTGIQAFYLTNGTVTCPKYKCYLTKPSAAESPAYYFPTDDDLTKIIDATTISTSDMPTFDLQGRKVDILVKGQIYIKCGKKFIAR